MRRVAVLVIPFLIAALGACGSGTKAITASATDRLSAEVAQLRSAAATGDRTAAEARLAAIRQTVAELRDGDDIGESEAAGVLAAAADVEMNLGLIPTTTVVTAPPRTRAPVEEVPETTVLEEAGQGDDKRDDRKKDKPDDSDPAEEPADSADGDD